MSILFGCKFAHRPRRARLPGHAGKGTWAVAYIAIRSFPVCHAGMPSGQSGERSVSGYDAQRFLTCSFARFPWLLRRSYQKTGCKAPIHRVSAFAARQRLVLGQGKVKFAGVIKPSTASDRPGFACRRGGAAWTSAHAGKQSILSPHPAPRRPSAVRTNNARAAGAGPKLQAQAEQYDGGQQALHGGSFPCLVTPAS